MGNWETLLPQLDRDIHAIALEADLLDDYRRPASGAPWRLSS